MPEGRNMKLKLTFTTLQRYKNTVPKEKLVYIQHYKGTKTQCLKETAQNKVQKTQCLKETAQNDIAGNNILVTKIT